MDSSHSSSAITLQEVKRLITFYPALISAKLADLEHARLHTIPAAISSRKPDSPDGQYLSKPELQQLVDWKLSHGTFRPTLRALVAQNPPDLVQETTAEAFALLAKHGAVSNAQSSKWLDTVMQALAVVTRLKGVGPATASLVLAAYDARQVPFFSDELARWLWYERAEEKGKGRGWERKLGYTVKEYRDLLQGVASVRARLRGDGSADEPTALELEKVAYVLGKTKGVEIGQVDGEAVGLEGDEEDGKDVMPGEVPVESTALDAKPTKSPLKSAAIAKGERSAKRKRKAPSHAEPEADTVTPPPARRSQRSRKT